MREWFIKTFMKRHAVRIYIAMPDKRLKEYWCIPKGDQVSIKGVGTFVLTIDEVSLSSKNVPTFIFNTTNPEPLDLQTGGKSVYSPEQFQVAIDSNIAKEIFLATKSGSISQDTMIILGVMVLGFAGLGYFITDQLKAITEILQALGIS